MNTDFLEEEIIKAIVDTVRSLGFEIVKVRLLGVKERVLEILLERLDNVLVTAEDCKVVSKHISVILDVMDIINGKYFLEVSSAGIERPLIKLADYERFRGHIIRVRLNKVVGERKKYIGKLLGMNNQQIIIEVLLHNLKEPIQVLIPLENIKEATLVLTDEMFKQAIK